MTASPRLLTVLIARPPDETADVYLVLRAAYVPEATLRSYIRRLVITLETHITSGGGRDAPDRDVPSASSEMIYSGTVDGESGEEPVILADKAEESEEEDESGSASGSRSGDDDTRYIYAVWKLSVFLGRPRMRLQSPSAIFTGTASLKPPAAATATDQLALPLPLSPSTSTNGVRDNDGGSSDGEYMASGVPSGLNLLEAFGDDPAMNGVRPRLSALRVSRVAPVTQQAKDLLRPIRALPKQLTLRIYPAVHSRIRFSRPHTAVPPGSGGAAIIAMLEIDFTSFFECEILLNSIDVSVRGSSGGVIIDDLTGQVTGGGGGGGGGGGLSLPLSCVAHDHVTFLYRIAPAAAEEDMLLAAGATGAVSKHPSRELAITIGATALAQPGVCEPTLRMAWSATVDFTLPLNPGYGPALQPIQRAHRPSQLSIGGAEAAASLVTTAVSRPDSIPSLEAATARSRETSLPELGITVTFAAPPATQKIYPGDAFAWTVFVVNRGPASAAATAASGGGGGPATPTAPPRKLALVAIPRRRRHDARVNRPPSVSSSSQVATAVPFPGGNSGNSVSYGHGHGHVHGHSYTQGYGYDKRASASTLQQQQQQQQYPTARDRTVADAVLDDAVVHAMQRGSGLDHDGAAAPLASLSADVRVGPLAPGACHAAELRFLALRPGVHAVEAVRVVDLGSNEHVDVRELPTVVVDCR